MIASSGMDLVLCAMEAGSGRARFGPRLSYALPVAELADLEAAGRIAVRADGLTLLDAVPTGEPHADEALSALESVDRALAWAGQYSATPARETAPCRKTASCRKTVLSHQPGARTLRPYLPPVGLRLKTGETGRSKIPA